MYSHIFTLVNELTGLGQVYFIIATREELLYDLVCLLSIVNRLVVTHHIVV